MKINHLGARRPVATLLFLAGLCALSVYALLGIRMDNSIEVWFASNDPKLHFYREFRERFGSEEFLMIALCKDDAFSEATMALAGKLVEELQTFEELERVESLSKVYSIWSESRKEADLPHDLETFREDTLTSPFYKGLLVSPSGRDMAIMAQMSPAGIADREGLAEKTFALIERVVPEERTVYYAGSAIFNSEMNRLSRESAMVFYPLVIASGAILLGVALRSLRATLIAAGAVLGSILWGVGLLSGTGHALNVVSSAMPPILLVSTLSYSLHFMMEYRRQVVGHRDRVRAVTATLDLVAIPCLLSALTTSIGFGSLMVSQVEPVIDLGTFAAIGVLGGYLAVVFGIGAAATLMGVPPAWKRMAKLHDRSEGERGPRHFGFQQSWFGARWLIVLLGVVFTVFALYQAQKVYFESNPFEFFPEENIITQSHHYLEEEMGGLSRLEVQVHGKAGEDLLDLSALNDFERAAAELVAVTHVTQVVTPGDYIKEAQRSRSLGGEEEYRLPRRQSQLRQIVAGILDENLKRRLEEQYAEDHTYAKLTLSLETLGSRVYGETLEDIEQVLEKTLGEKYETEPTGIVPLIASSQKYMVDSQVKSLSLALALISLTFVVLLRSIRLTILGLLPNLVPILGTFGLMGWIALPLDVATIMVASVSLGIVVDNTIHFLFRYTRNLKRESPLDAVIDTLKTSGQAIAFAGIINCVGFGVLIFSGFQPMRNFGSLVSFTMFLALLGATILLPALLLTLGPSRKTKD
jgi:predicted RND superfamily exporter protein